MKYAKKKGGGKMKKMGGSKKTMKGSAAVSGPAVSLSSMK